MILLEPKEKYRKGGTAKRGKPGGSNDQGTKHASKRKASEAERAVIKATQPKKYMLLRGGKQRMVTITERTPA